MFYIAETDIKSVQQFRANDSRSST